MRKMVLAFISLLFVENSWALSSEYSSNGVTLKVISSEKLSLQSDRDLMIPGQTIGDFVNLRAEKKEAVGEDILTLYGKKNEHDTIKLTININGKGDLFLKFKVDNYNGRQMRLVEASNELIDLHSVLYELYSGGGGINYVLMIGKDRNFLEIKTMEMRQTSFMGIQQQLQEFKFDH